MGVELALIPSDHVRRLVVCCLKPEAMVVPICSKTVCAADMIHLVFVVVLFYRSTCMSV